MGKSPAVMDTFKFDEEKEEQLDGRVYNYLNRHGVMASIPTTYTLSSHTLMEDRNKIILFQCRSFPACAQIDYKNFANQQPLSEESFEINKEPVNMLFFKCFNRESSDAQLKELNKRYFHRDYGNNQPRLSADQKLLLV